MKAWVTKETTDATTPDGKGQPRRVRELAAEGAKGVLSADRFVVEWIDPAGKRCREKIAGCGRHAKKLADDRCKQLNSQMALGQYAKKDNKTWGDFLAQYRAKVLNGMEAPSRRVMEDALRHFERLCKPKGMLGIDTETVDGYVAKRRTERGKKPGSIVSRATVNKELRHLRAALRKATRWGYLKQSPEFTFLKEDGKLPRYVTPEHFAAIYAACDIATRPAIQGATAADWWRALMVFAYMTGWRIDEILTFPREDLDLDAGRAFLRAPNTKGRRDDFVPLATIAIEHLRSIAGFTAGVFDWPHSEKALYEQFTAIQAVAGIELACHGEHEHTVACHVYGFHDLRRAFATLNAERLTGDALQKLMRHKSYATTQRYINVATQLNRAVDNLYVPTLPAIEAPVRRDLSAIAVS